MTTGKNKNKGNSTLTMGSKTGRKDHLISQLCSTVLTSFNADAEFPSPNSPVRTRPSVASRVQMQSLVFVGGTCVRS